MQDISLWAASQDWLNLVVNILILVVPTLVGGTLIVLSGRGLASTLRTFAKTVRPAVDEVTDPTVVAIAKKLHVDPQQVVDVLKEVLDQLDEAQAIQDFAAEINRRYEVK